MRKVVAVLLTAVTIAVLMAAMSTAYFVDGAVEMKEYFLSADGEHVGNIPYGDYVDEARNAVYADKEIFNITDFGASPSASARVNTDAIRSAICAADASGGIVEVSGGTYYTGTVYMASGITLRVASGSALKLPEFGSITDGEREELINGSLIAADGVHGWTICGAGTLDGSGESYTTPCADSAKNLPLEVYELKKSVLNNRAKIRQRRSGISGYNIISANGCQDITIKNICIKEPSVWTVVLGRCVGVNITDVIIDNNFYIANSDGIDVCGTSNVNIEHCFIATGDDGIVLKSAVGEIHNVTVKNCEIMSLANNFKIGTETGNDVSNVVVEDCYFFRAEVAGGYSGIAIESADGANIKDVSVRGVAMNNVTAAFLVWLGCRLDKNKGSDGITVGSIDNVTIADIYAIGVDLPSAIVGCRYRGEEKTVGKVNVSDITIKYRECEEKLDIYEGEDNVLHNNENGYPEITRVSHAYLISHQLSLYYDLPVCGIYTYLAPEVTMSKCNITPRSGNTRELYN